MKQTLKYLFVFFIFSYNGFSQNQCECPNESKIRKEVASNPSKENLYEKLFSVNDNAACELAELFAFAYTLKDKSKKLELVKQRKANLISACNKKILAEAYYLLGSSYYENEESLDSVASFYLKGRDIAKQINNIDLLSRLESGLASCYFDLELTDKAIEFYESAANNGIKGDNYELAAKAFGNAASAYGMKFDSKQEPSCLDSAIVLLNRSNLCSRISGYTKQLEYNYGTFSGVFMLMKKYELALQYCDSILLMKNIQESNKAIIYSRKSEINWDIGNYKEALVFADSTYKYAVISMPPSEIIATMNLLVKCYSKLGDYKNMAMTQARLITYKDSVGLLETNERIDELQKKYNQVKNEKTINELNQQKEIDDLRIRSLIGVSAIALLIIVIIIFLYRQSVVKSKMRIVETEQRLNRARINPHFFFNAMASLQALALDGKKQDETSEYIHRFSKIMRESLESTFNELNTIENEIEFLTHYLELQKLRSDNKFTYQFEVDETIETDSLMIPGMILQPFIENSIEHGFSSIETGGKINISFKIENNQLKVSVIDNGSGFKESDKHKGYPSRATQIVRDRLYLLNKQYKTNAIFELTNLMDKGTKVEIQLPIIPKS